MVCQYWFHFTSINSTHNIITERGSIHTVGTSRAVAKTKVDITIFSVEIYVLVAAFRSPATPSAHYILWFNYERSTIVTYWNSAFFYGRLLALGSTKHKRVGKTHEPTLLSAVKIKKTLARYESKWQCTISSFEYHPDVQIGADRVGIISGWDYLCTVFLWLINI